jgi:hypothetical protein
MHENREISCTSCSKEQDRSAEAINRTADMNVPEKSDCAVVPVNQPNKGGRTIGPTGGRIGLLDTFPIAGNSGAIDYFLQAID